jgi:hypothetical protein
VKIRSLAPSTHRLMAKSCSRMAILALLPFVREERADYGCSLCHVTYARREAPMENGSELLLEEFN